MIKAKKSLGQNFLQDESVIDSIIEASGADNTTDVIEIGPRKRRGNTTAFKMCKITYRNRNRRTAVQFFG